jgi:polysaccharide biosynthesis protein PslE
MEFSPTMLDHAVPATPPPPHNAVGATLREVLTHLFYDSRRIRAVLLLGLLATALAAYLAPLRYVAEASLLLRLGREYIYTPEIGEATPGAPVAYDREQTLLAEARILSSRDTLELALDAVGLPQAYPAIAASTEPPARQRAQALLAMEKALDAELLKGSNLLQISFKHADAATSARMLDQVIQAYLAKRATVFSSSSYDSAEADFRHRKKQLEDTESQLALFKRERGIRSFAEEQSLLLAQRNTLEQRQTDSALSLAQAGGRAQALRTTLQGLQADVTLSSETQRSEAVDHARKLLLDLKLKERDLSAKFSDSHLSVLDVRADIERTSQYLQELEAKPNRAVRSGRSPARDVGESDLLRSVADERQARAGTSTLATRRTAIDQRLAELAEAESRLRTLERDRRLAEANYEAAAKRLRDESTLQDLDRKRRSSVSVVQAPRTPLEAKSLRPVVAVVGVFLSLCAALLVAFLSALWRDTYLLPEQLQRDVDVPLLAAIPEARP